MYEVALEGRYIHVDNNVGVQLEINNHDPNIDLVANTYEDMDDIDVKYGGNESWHGTDDESDN